MRIKKKKKKKYATYNHVLIRLKYTKVADIEKAFHKVGLQTEARDFTRFSCG
jgi:hypothetical protein